MDSSTQTSQSPTPTNETPKSITRILILLAALWLSTLILHNLIFFPFTPNTSSVLFFFGSALLMFTVMSAIVTFTYLTRELSKYASEQTLEYYWQLCAGGESLATMVLGFRVEDVRVYIVGLMWPVVVLWTIFAFLIVSSGAEECETDLENGVVTDAGEMEIDECQRDGDETLVEGEGGGKLSMDGVEERGIRDCDCEDGECEHQALISEGRTRGSAAEDRRSRNCECTDEECEHQTLMTERRISQSKAEFYFDMAKEYDREYDRRLKDEEEAGRAKKVEVKAAKENERRERADSAGSAENNESADARSASGSGSERSYVEIEQRKGQ